MCITFAAGTSTTWLPWKHIVLWPNEKKVDTIIRYILKKEPKHWYINQEKIITKFK